MKKYTSGVQDLAKFGRWLRAHRVKRRMLQIPFAEFLGTTQSIVCKLENGKPDNFGMNLRNKIEEKLGERYED